ncbi:hypothetical protein BDF19DRAFT_423393 [Syncephalis fuscata]|nr:hypothetical protein BDF19DRAFT_423393 [Syncephalis fuscata]
MHVTGDQFIRTLSAYMRSHESTWSHHPSNASTATNILVSWLGYSNGSGSGSSSSVNNNNLTPFIVDPWHLFYLNARFEELGLAILEWEDDVIESNIEAQGQMTKSATLGQNKDTTNTASAAVASLQRAVKPPSIVSVASHRSVASTAMTLLTGFARWSSTGSNSNKANEAPHTTVEEDVRFIHQCMQQIAAVRIGPFGKRRILDADDGTDRPEGIQVSLGAFSNIRQLEVVKISPLALTGWMRLQSQLERVGCRGRLNKVEDLLLKTLQLEMHQRMMNERHEKNKESEGENAVSTQVDLEALCQLSPMEVWPRLIALDLMNNSLTDIPDHPFLYVRHCMELNLSRNLFTTVPLSLKDLGQLRSLDLSHNKIESLTGVGELLPTLVQLSLASNQLQSIAGLEQLPRLERLDISHNRIQDPHEVNRLSSLLHLSHLQVEGNPLVEIPYYRVTIFSLLYGGAQLYLDGATPSFIERRQMKNRPADAVEAIPAAIIATQVGAASSPSPVSPRSKPRRKPTRLVALSQQEEGLKRESSDSTGLGILVSPNRSRPNSYDAYNPDGRLSRDLTGSSLPLDSDRWESLDNSQTSTAEWPSNEHDVNTDDVQGTTISDSMIMIDPHESPVDMDTVPSPTTTTRPDSGSSNNSKTRRVHRVIGLEASVSEGLATPTKGINTPRHRQRRATVDNLRAASPSSMVNYRQASQHQVNTSSPPQGRPGDEFRRRIEAMRNEAGSTWLRVYNEIQYRERASPTPNARRRESVDPLIQDDQNEHLLSSSTASKPMITLAGIRASRLQRAQASNSSNNTSDDKEDDTSPSERRLSKDDLLLNDSSLTSENSTDMKRSLSDSHKFKPIPIISLTTSTPTSALNEGKPLLTADTQTIIAQVQETVAKLHRRASRVPFESRQLMVETKNDPALLEINLDGEKLMARRRLNTLIYVARAGTDRAGATLLQLRFKATKTAPIITVRYRIMDSKAADQLMSVFEHTYKSNWEGGYVHKVCKQSKCLSCQWIGIHEHDLTGMANELNNITTDEANRLSGIIEDKQCPQCRGTFLVEFFDNSPANSNTANTNRPQSDNKHDTNTSSVNKGGLSSSADKLSSNTDSSLLASLMSSVSPSWPKMDTFLNLGGHYKDPSDSANSPVLSSSSSLTPPSHLSGWSRLAGRVAEVAAVPHENVFTSLLGYQPILPPYQTNSNSLRLHFHLSVFEDDSENLLTWIPCSFIIQAPPNVSIASAAARWTRVRGEPSNNVPTHCPVERPVYLALSTKAFYLVELCRPLTGGVAAVAAAASIYNPFSWQRDSTASSPNSAPVVAPNLLGVTNKVAEGRPEQYLHILRKITPDQLAHIDVGPRQQSLTFHLQPPTTKSDQDHSSNNNNSSSGGGSSSSEDQRSIAIFIRDIERCDEILDLLQHKFEWTTQQQQQQNDGESKSFDKLVRHDTKLWRECLAQTIWTPEESDAITMAFEENLIETLPEPIWLTAWVSPQDKCIRSCTLVATLQHLYITTERFDVWPPSIDDAHSVLGNYHKTPVQGDKMSTVVPRFEAFKKVPLLNISKLTYARVGWSAALVDEQAHEGYTAASWSCSVRLDYRIDNKEEVDDEGMMDRAGYWVFLFHTRNEATHCVETINQLYQIVREQQQQEEEGGSGTEALRIEECHPTDGQLPANATIAQSPEMQRVPSIQEEAVESKDV